jgi:hypothetical protein
VHLLSTGAGVDLSAPGSPSDDTRRLASLTLRIQVEAVADEAKP